MQIYISSDHGGFKLKQEILSSGVAIMTDMGPYEFIGDDDYPLYGFPLAERVAKEGGEELDRKVIGILICRSGNGMAIVANKVKGIRACLCVTPEHARAAVEHNDANVLVLDADYSQNNSIEIVESFLAARFAGGRHERRVNQISEYENRNSLDNQIQEND